MTPHAAFAVVVLPSGRIAATTRPSGGIGLPGGKLEPGESPVACAAREAAEEGWLVTSPLGTVHEQDVDGRKVVWVLFGRAERLASYKESGRIEPIDATVDEVLESGMGNDVALPRALMVWARLIRRIA